MLRPWVRISLKARLFVYLCTSFKRIPQLKLNADTEVASFPSDGTVHYGSDVSPKATKPSLRNVRSETDKSISNVFDNTQRYSVSVSDTGSRICPVQK
jgi:hypothetical protein